MFVFPEDVRPQGNTGYDTNLTENKIQRGAVAIDNVLRAFGINSLAISVELYGFLTASNNPFQLTEA